MWQQVFSGLEAGSWYSLVALGIVVVMKATDVPNFAMAEIGLVGTFVGWTLHSIGAPFAVVAVGAVVTGSVVGVMTNALLMRPLAGRGHFPLLLMTIGLAVALNAGISLIWGTQPRELPAPWVGADLMIVGIRVSWTSVLTILIGIVAVVVLTWFFKSATGAQMRAVAENDKNARVVGVSVWKISTVAWAIGGALAATAMVLQVQATLLFTGSAQSVIIYGFIAATLGGFVSLVGAFVGGLALGLFQQLASEVVTTGFQSAVALTIVLIVLLLRPHGLSAGTRLRDV